MSYTFSRRDFLKYSAMTAVAVAGAGLLTGCEIQDPNNPVIKKLGYGTTLGTTGGLLKSVDTEGTTGVFTFTVKNNSDAPLRMTPNDIFTVKVLDATGKTKWSNYFNLSIKAVLGEDGKAPDILPELPPRTVGEYKVHVPDYAGHAPNPEDTLEFIYIPNPAKSPELRITWKIPGADLVKSNESTGK
ncbi:twin-arginine translocation signal domain-containing protein [uncultured Faecalibacterium sp.]|jgi:hypothetical protein|uniref:twin-arginine translocation signal domain-containing protein n=1 Tax=uncultured Faecalibacterium sp. TaxID=259315 RepID=UPI0026DBA311|nr:twin-arginine translocation signal domain-containing protein [uncultured Faecalibacterium sp.]